MGIALPWALAISSATDRAAALFKSAMATLPPSRAKVSAISFPMPLAAPVTMATLSFKRMAPLALLSELMGLLQAESRYRSLAHVVVHDLAEAERQIRENVDCGDNLEYRQLGDRGQRMRGQRQGCGAGPGALERNVLQIIFHELAHARAAVDVRDDLQQEIRQRERGFDGLQVGLAVLIAHRAGRDPKRSVIERADERIDLGLQFRVGELLRKSPELAPAGDRPLVVEEHAMGVATFAAAEGNRYDLTSFRVVAEAGRIRHADELVTDERRALVELQRLRYDSPQFGWVGTVGDGQVFAIDEPIRTRRIGWVGQRHCKRPLAHFRLSHSPRSFPMHRCGHSRPSLWKSKMKIPSRLFGRSSTSGWRSVRTAS